MIRKPRASSAAMPKRVMRATTCPGSAAAMAGAITNGCSIAPRVVVTSSQPPGWGARTCPPITKRVARFTRSRTIESCQLCSTPRNRISKRSSNMFSSACVVGSRVSISARPQAPASTSVSVKVTISASANRAGLGQAGVAAMEEGIEIQGDHCDQHCG